MTENKYFHSDIKPDNIIIDEVYKNNNNLIFLKIFLIDFGFCT